MPRIPPKSTASTSIGLRHYTTIPVCSLAAGTRVEAITEIAGENLALTLNYKMEAGEGETIPCADLYNGLEEWRQVKLMVWYEIHFSRLIISHIFHIFLTNPNSNR